MANTSYLRYTVELWVRSQLEVRFNQTFSSQVLALSPGGRHEFDAVSSDGSIVVAIKTSSGLTRGGKRPAGKIAACLTDVYFLTLVVAPVRILVLTNPSFYELFTRVTRGQIPNDIGVELLALSPEMQLKVDDVARNASDELKRDNFENDNSSLTQEELSESSKIDHPAPGDFWTYENDVHKYARVHKADCSFCNYGAGVHDVSQSAVGRWIRSYKEVDAMNASEFSTERCSRCLPDL